MSFKDIFQASKIREQNEQLLAINANLQKQIEELGVTEYLQTKEKIAELEKQSEIDLNNANKKLETLNSSIVSSNQVLSDIQTHISELHEKEEKLSKTVSTQERKIGRCKELYKSVEYAISNFLNLEVPYRDCKLPLKDYEELELISPSVILKLHCMDVKSLRKAYNDNEKQINSLLEQ